MTLAYRPGEGVLHGLDPRAKLALQAGFAAAAFAHTTPVGLAVLTPVAVVAPRLAGASVRDALSEFLVAVPFLLAGPLVAGLTLGAPWFRLPPAVHAALASYRVGLLLLVATAYVYSTPVRESRAAVRWLLPGRLGAITGVGVSLVFRFLPVLQGDLSSRRDAVNARLGGERSLRERMRLVGLGGLGRAFSRADRLAVALRARCFAWNPTEPPLSFGRGDWLATAGAGCLVAAVFV